MTTATGRQIILDLCGGTGSWSEPYRERLDEYDVRLITLPHRDVLTYRPPRKVHGVLAAPPCTHFSASGARWWAAKDLRGDTEPMIGIVRACLDIIEYCRPEWWALENPAGRIARLVPELGKPSFSFQPYEFGDPWTKRTMLWGNFRWPAKLRAPIKPVSNKGLGRWRTSLTNHLSPRPTADQIRSLVESGMIPADWIHRLGPCPERATLRSITPPSFAAAFFRANR